MKNSELIITFVGLLTVALFCSWVGYQSGYSNGQVDALKGEQHYYRNWHNDITYHEIPYSK